MITRSCLIPNPELPGRLIRGKVIVPHSQLRYPGVCFRPFGDIIYLNSSSWRAQSFLAGLKPNEIETSNILYLAVRHETFRSIFAWLLLGPEWPEVNFFRGLKEMIVIAAYEDEEVTAFLPIIGISGISDVRREVEEYIRSFQETKPGLQLPIAKVMTESMLTMYVEGLANTQTGEASRTR